MLLLQIKNLNNPSHENIFTFNNTVTSCHSLLILMQYPLFLSQAQCSTSPQGVSLAISPESPALCLTPVKLQHLRSSAALFAHFELIFWSPRSEQNVVHIF